MRPSRLSRPRRVRRIEESERKRVTERGREGRGKETLARPEKVFINSTYRASLVSARTYLYSYTYVKLLKRLKPIIGQAQTDLAWLLPPVRRLTRCSFSAGAKKESGQRTRLLSIGAIVASQSRPFLTLGRRISSSSRLPKSFAFVQPFLDIKRHVLLNIHIRST